MMLVMILILALVFLYIALRDIRWAVFVIAALLPTHLVRFEIGPLPSTLLEVLLVIIILVWGIKHRGFQLASPRLFAWRWPILLLLLAGITSVVVAPDTRAALGVFRAYLIEPILFFFVAVSVLRDRRDIERLITAFAVSAAALSIYAIIQRITGLGIPDTWSAERRVTSFFPYPNALGLFLAPLIPLFITIGLKRVLSYFDGRQNMIMILVIIFWFGVAALSLLAIIFAKTEGAIVGLIATGILVALYYKKTRWITVVVIVVMGFGLFAAGPNHPITQKLLLRDWSGMVRQTQWTETLAMLRDYPIFGAGLAGYPMVLGPYHKAFYFEIFQYPHNIILNFWSELGLLGLAAFIWIILLFFKTIRYTLQHATPYKLAIAAAMLTLLIHGLVDVPYFKNDLAIQFWLLIAAAPVLASPALHKPDQKVE